MPNELKLSAKWIIDTLREVEAGRTDLDLETIAMMDQDIRTAYHLAKKFKELQEMIAHPSLIRSQQTENQMINSGNGGMERYEREIDVNPEALMPRAKGPALERDIRMKEKEVERREAHEQLPIGAITAYERNFAEKSCTLSKWDDVSDEQEHVTLRELEESEEKRRHNAKIGRMDGGVDRYLRDVDPNTAIQNDDLLPMIVTDQLVISGDDVDCIEAPFEIGLFEANEIVNPLLTDSMVQPITISEPYQKMSKKNEYIMTLCPPGQAENFIPEYLDAEQRAMERMEELHPLQFILDRTTSDGSKIRMIKRRGLSWNSTVRDPGEWVEEGEPEFPGAAFSKIYGYEGGVPSEIQEALQAMDATWIPHEPPAPHGRKTPDPIVISEEGVDHRV